jgi:hypothetical protein
MQSSTRVYSGGGFIGGKGGKVRPWLIKTIHALRGMCNTTNENRVIRIDALVLHELRIDRHIFWKSDGTIPSPMNRLADVTHHLRRGSTYAWSAGRL